MKNLLLTYLVLTFSSILCCFAQQRITLRTITGEGGWEFPAMDQRVRLQDDVFGELLTELVITSSNPGVKAERVPGENYILVSIDDGALVLPTDSAMITVESALNTQVFEVFLDSLSYSVSKLIPDPVRNRLYGLMQNGESTGGLVIVFDTLQKLPVSAVEVPRYPNNFAIKDDGSELAVIGSLTNSVARIDLETLEVIKEHPLSGFGRERSLHNVRIAYGPNEVFYFLGDERRPALRVFDYSSDTLLQMLSGSGVEVESFSVQTGREIEGLVVSLKRNRVLLRTLPQFGRLGAAALVEFDIQADGRLAGYRETFSDFDRFPPDDRDNVEESLSGDGDTLIAKNLIFDMDDTSDVKRVFEKTLTGLSDNGEAIASVRTILSAESGEEFHTFSTSDPNEIALTRVFLPDYSYTVSFNQYTQSATQSGLVWTPLLPEPGLGAMGLSVSPADGATIQFPLGLHWLPVTGAREYEIYLSRDEAELNVADPSSPAFFGKTRLVELALQDPLSAGEYFWKVVSDSGQESQVYSFSVAPFELDQREIQFETIVGDPSLKGVISLTSSSTTNWSATSSQPWIVFETTVGSVADSVRFSVDPEGLVEGDHEASIMIEQDGERVIIPVFLKLNAVNYTHVKASSDGPYLYLVSELDLPVPEAYLIKLDTRNDEVVEVVTCSGGITDISVNSRERRIYLADSLGAEVGIYDLESLERLGAFRFTDEQGEEVAPEFVASGPLGRIMVAADRYLYLLDTGSGLVLDSLRWAVSGNGVFSPDGLRYFHGEGGTGNPALHSFNLMNDTIEVDAFYGQYLRSSTQQMFMSQDGSSIFWKDEFFDLNLESLGDVPNGEILVTASAFGDFYSTTKGFYRRSDQSRLINYPVESTMQAISRDHKKIYLASGESLRVLSLDGISGLKALEIIPVIEDGAVVRGPNPKLEWGPLPSAVSYRVYLGQSREAVQSADVNGVEYLGETEEAIWQIGDDPVLEYGTTYYWRVDEVNANGSKVGSVWSFEVSPVDLEDRIVTLQAPKETSPFRLTLPVVGSPLAPWEVTANEPWINVVNSSGQVGGDVELEIDSSLMNDAQEEGELVLSSGGVTTRIPILVELIDLDISKIVSSPEGSDAIAISKRATPEDPTFLVLVSGATGKITKFVPISSTVSDFDIEDSTGNVFLIDGETGGVEVRNGSSFDLEREFTLSKNYKHLKVSSAGLMLVSSNIRFIFEPHDSVLVDSQTGEELAELPSEFRLIQNVDFTKEGGVLFTFSSESKAARYEVSREGVVLSMESSTVAPYTSLSMEFLLSDDLETIVAGLQSFDGSLELEGALSVASLDLDPTGSLIAQEGALVWSRSGGVARMLPFESTVRVFTSDGRTLISFDPTTGKFETVDLGAFVPLYGNSPQPGFDSPMPPESLSIDEVVGAISYELLWSRDGANFLSAGSAAEPTFETPSDLPHLGKVFWRIDTMTEDGEVAGEISSFTVYPLEESLSFVSNDARDVAADVGQVVVGSHFSDFWTFPILEDLPTKALSVPIDPSLGTLIFSGEAVATTGLRSFKSAEVISGPEGFVMSAVKPDGTRDPATFHELIRSNRSGAMELAASGDLLMVSALNRSDQTGFVEVYQTLPVLKLEQTLTSDQNSMGFRMAAGGDILVTGNRSSPTGTIILSVFKRGTGPSPWTLRSSLSIATISGPEYRLDTDGQTVALLHKDPGNNQRVSIYSVGDDGKLTIEQSILKDEIHPGLIGEDLDGVAIDRDQIVVGADDARVRAPNRDALFVIEKINGTWLSTMALTRERLVMSEKYIDISDGWVYSSAGAGVVRFDVRNGSSPGAGFRGYPEVLAVAGRTHREDLEIVGDLEKISVQIVEGPAWLSLVNDGGTWHLEGDVPDLTRSDFVRLKVSDERGKTSFRSYSLQTIAGAQMPEIAGVDGAGDIVAGQGIALVSRATGLPPLNYQWYKDGVALSDQNSKTLSINNGLLSDAGSYTVVVSNIVGSVESEPIEIVVGESGREAGDWTTFGNSPAHRGHHPAVLGTHLFIPHWEAQLPDTSYVTRAVIAEGKVFVTHRDPADVEQGTFGSPAKVYVYDASTGALVWERDLGRSVTVNPPTYHKGRLYVQRNDLRGSDPGSQLVAMNAEDGEILWQSPYGSQNERYEAPVVTDEGIWMQGGEYGGLVGVDLDGTRRFFNRHGQSDGWTPSFENGRLFTWLGGGFREIDPVTGENINVRSLGSYGERYFSTVPAITSRGAVLRAPDFLILYDFDLSEIVWEVPVTGRLNSPAVYRDLIYLNEGNEVKIFDLGTGDSVGAFQAPEYLSSSQPLLLNDLLFTSSGQETFVFDREGGELLQTLPVGGELSYSNGYLTVAGATGKLSVFFANDVADLLTVDLGDVVEDIPVDEMLQIRHEDSGEDVSFRKVSGPEWLNVDSDGRLTGVFGNIVAGPRTLVVELDDGQLAPVEYSISLNMIAVNDPPEAAGILGDLVATPAADPVDLDLKEEFTDPDPGDFLVFSITGNTNPEIFSDLTIDNSEGRLLVSFAPYQEGSSQVTIRATDQEGVFVERTITITLPELPAPQLNQLGEIILNRRTGLFEQTLTIKNEAQRAIGGFDLSVSGLTNSYVLFGIIGGEINFHQELGAGESVELLLEYHSPETREPPVPEISISKALPKVEIPVDQAGEEPGRIVVLPNRSILLEFASVPGKSYRVVYSTDMSTWFASPVEFKASANRTHWIDNGFPKTNCHPRDCPARFYRIIELSTASE